MPPELYQELEQRISAEFQRDMREPVSPGLKFSVTLRHLATGDSYTTRQYAFRVASSTIKKFVSEVCDAITRAYRDQGDTVSHTTRRLVAGRVHLLPEGAQGGGSLFATARASTPLYSWPWWMEIPSSCGWTWGQLCQLQMIRFSSTPI